MSKKMNLGAVGLVLLAITGLVGSCAPGKAPGGPGPDQAYLPGAGTKIPIGPDHFFVYGFDRKPKLGTVILKVQVYDREQRKVTPYEVFAEADMTAMAGVHATGPLRFSLSQKGDYLVPLDLVMPGEWIIKLWVRQVGKEVFTGRIRVEI